MYEWFDFQQIKIQFHIIPYKSIGVQKFTLNFSNLSNCLKRLTFYEFVNFQQKIFK